MDTKPAKRGRPPKNHTRRKGEYLDIRLEAAEKEAFRDAADLAGLDLSVWVRARLRTAARKELDKAERPVAFMTTPANRAPRPDRVLEARFVPPSRMFIRFADGLAGTWSFRKLSLDMTNVKSTTIRVAGTGAAVLIKGKWNDNVELDASALRAAVDPPYAAQLKKTFLAIIGPLDKLPSIPQR